MGSTQTKAVAGAVASVCLALLLWVLEEIGFSLNPIFATLVIVGCIVGFIWSGTILLFDRASKKPKPHNSVSSETGSKSFTSDPGLEYLSAQLAVAKRFIKQEKELATSVDANSPPSHEAQFKLIQDTERDLRQIDLELADQLSDTDWESVPFKQWMGRVETLSKSAPKGRLESAPSPRVLESRRTNDPPLVEQLNDLLGEGLKLLDDWLDMGSGRVPRGPITSAEDIENWEFSILALLRTSRPIHFAMFTSELPQPSMSQLAAMPNSHRRRLVHRLQILERIIVEMRGY